MTFLNLVVEDDEEINIVLLDNDKLKTCYTYIDILNHEKQIVKSNFFTYLCD